MGRPPKYRETDRLESSVRMATADQTPMFGEPLMRPDESPLGIDIVTAEALPQDVIAFRDPVARIINLTRDPEVLQSVEERPWHPMDTALQDGTLIEGKSEDGSEFLMVWRQTTRFNARAGKWDKVGFWSSHLTREPIKMELVSWRVQEGFCMPGAVAV